MIEKMTRYSFILLKGEREEFLLRLQELGVVDIVRSERPIDETSSKMMIRVLEAKENIAMLEKGEDDHLRQLRDEFKALKLLRDSLAPWGEYNRSRLAGLGVPVHFHIVVQKAFNPAWAEECALEIVAEQDGKCWFVVLGEDPIKAGVVSTPELTYNEAAALLEDKKAEIAEYEAILEARKSEIPRWQAVISDSMGELGRYLAGATAAEAAEGSLCVFEGYAPATEAGRLARAFDAMPVYWEARDAQASDNPPVKLKSNRFVSLFESITRMYGLPVYDEFDPTPLLSIFFLLFFAMCMGDAGYGLVLIAAGWAIAKGKLKIAMFDGLGPIISVLGVGTFFVGIVLGTFFGIDIYAASWVPEWLKGCMIKGKIAGYDAQMVLALGVGVVHICLALIFKAIYAVRREGILASLSTLGWTLLIVGGVVIGAVALLASLPSTVIKWLVIGLGALSALGIFIFNKPGRNPLANVGAGLWDTYQMVTGLLGDVLSYIRLYALGLAGGLLGAAFNNLAMMVAGDNPTWQWPFVLAILLIGHVLNLLMSCLGAFVHPLRLNFVEFFKNSGYEGKGLKYNPLKK